MEADCTDYAPVITSQADIENEDFAKYNCFKTIGIQNATGSLNFTNAVEIHHVTVLDCPSLEILNFPVLLTLYDFATTNASSLTTVSMPRLPAGIYDGMTITGAPALQNLDFGNATAFNFLKLIGSGNGTLNIPNVTTIRSLEMSPITAEFPSLERVESVMISSIIRQGIPSSIPFPRVTSFGDFILKNDLDMTADYMELMYPNTINGSLVLQSLKYVEVDPPYEPFSLDFAGTSIIGQSASIESNSNVDMDLSGVMNVGGNFSFINNTNCSLNIRQLSSVGDLIMMDNINTTLPFLPNLKTANNIHLRGYIDPTPGANIFPALSLVSGSVTIETWNSDFNCSKLVSQFRESIIHNLSCNGTDNSTAVSIATPSLVPSSESNASDGLSDGAWAGISVGIGAIFLGSIIAAVWLFLHYRRQQDRTAEDESPDSQQKEEVQPPTLSGLYEAEDSRIIREAPDGAVYEMAVPPAEKPDDHVREMEVPPVEKPDDHIREMDCVPGELPASLPGAGLG